MMVILEDKKDDIKQAFFYDRVPLGGKIRAFGSPTKFNDNPLSLPRTARAERYASMLRVEPEQMLTQRADNYHRWFGTDWAFIELCGPAHSNDWNAAAEARLKRFVEYGHSLGYLVSLYEINGFWTTRIRDGRRSLISVHSKQRVSAGTRRSRLTPISSPRTSTRIWPGSSGRNANWLCE
jgi:hypothetical protein